MKSTGKHRLAMALGLVLLVSACGGGAGSQPGVGPAVTAPATTAAQSATPASPAAAAAATTGTGVSSLDSQTPGGDPGVYQTEAVAGSGSFRGLFRNILTLGRGDPAPAVAPEAASAPRTAAGGSAAAQTSIQTAAVAPVYAPTYAEPERSGLFNGYFRNLFKSDKARDTARVGGPIGGTFGRNIDPEVTLRVNRYIWTAALDVLSFLPLETVDPFSGVFVTGFGVPPGGGRAYRATVYVQDPALDARSLHVALEAKGGSPVTLETTRAVENAILTRARQLRIAENNR